MARINCLYCFILIGCFLTPGKLFCQANKTFTRADSLRGQNGPGRSTWDLLHYEITIRPDFLQKLISGVNTITLTDKGITTLQLDLQAPLEIDSIKSGTIHYGYTREGNVYWVKLRSMLNDLETFPHERRLTVYYHGKPAEAVNPPWDGGWIFKKDRQNRPWMSIACEGIGASSWFPCKDILSDEPDRGAILHIVTPDSLVGVGNGRLKKKQPLPGNQVMYSWEVVNPINNYCIIPAIGKYVNFSEAFQGEKGRLDIEHWVLDYNLQKAREHFKDVPKMLKAFEYWFGPYPFYEDGYKLVDAPYLGMENQSALAYGNQYMKGYLGSDRSSTGVGMLWDFIIIHESGHEWFGNSITANDIADLWIHESFTSYSEVLFTERVFGKKAADRYCIGTRNEIENKHPSIGRYGVNDNPSSLSADMYWKGSNMLHTIRQVINNDKLFRSILKGLNKQYYHKTVSGEEIQDFFSKKSGKDLTCVFRQYLGTAEIPTLEYHYDGKKLNYRWTNVVENFRMPVRVKIGTVEKWLHPSSQWRSIEPGKKFNGKIEVHRNFYVRTKQSDQ